MKLGLSRAAVAERRSGIYGTDANRIVEGDWPRLWREKKGLEEPEDLNGVLRVQLGSWTEKFNLDWYERQTGRQVAHRGERRLGPRLSPGQAPMGAHLDGLTTTSKGCPAYIDAKHVGRADETTIIRYTPQMTHCALVCGVEWWCISFLVGNSRWELVEQELDPFFAEELLALEAAFWSYVERGEEPPDRAAIMPPKPAPAFRSVDLAGEPQPGWPNWGQEMAAEMVAFINTKPAADRHAIARERIKSLLPEDVGLVTRGAIEVKRRKDLAVTIAIKPGGKRWMTNMDMATLRPGGDGPSRQARFLRRWQRPRPRSSGPSATAPTRTSARPMQRSDR